jgi:ketosteroid isomerase-like protein
MLKVYSTDNRPGNETTMMICPTCNARYEDDTLKFCLEDGTPLAPGPVTEAPTVAFGDIETVVSPRRTGEARGGWDQSSAAPFVPQQPQARKSNTGLTVFLTALGMLIIFGIVGAGAWIYLGGRNGGTPQDNSLTSIGTSNNETPNSKPNTRSSPSPTANGWSNTLPSPAEPVNAVEIKKEVAKTIYTWKSTAESHDLDSYMGNYAETVDYYLKKGASRSAVRADKQRAFDRFDTLESDISNIDITVAPSGNEATALFDKEWEFEGETRSKGKVRQEMRFKKVNGEWLITAEKDIKVYYTE